MTLDWSRFEKGSLGPERAFEAFSAQLFERWIRREYPDRVELYVLNGAGGDGGVEAFATLADGMVVGLQAKWFPGNLDDGRVRQVRNSIDRARGSYPTLRRYVVALPCNLTASGSTRKTGKGRRTRGGVDRWADLIRWVEERHTGLDLDRWDEAGLLNQLAAGDQRLRALWFGDAFLSLEELREAWAKVRAQLHHRYLPDLHATGEIERAVAVDLFDPEQTERLAREVLDAKDRFEHARRRIEDLRHYLTAKGDLSLDDALADTLLDLQTLAHHANVLVHAARRGPLGALPTFPDLLAIGGLAERLESLHRRSFWHVSDLARGSVGQALEAVNSIRRVHDDWIAARRPRIVVGPPGCGKTHASAHLVEQLLASGIPAVCVDARFVRPSRGLAKIIGDVLDRPGWPLRQLLDALEALTMLSQCTEQKTDGYGFKRALLVLDGLEESVGWEGWAPLLAELAVQCKRRPRLHVLVSMRPETYQQLAPPPAFLVQSLDEDAGASLPEMFDRYCRHYRVDAAAVPWLGWAIRSPLEVRLVAEEFEGRALTHDDGVRANMIGLFRTKLDRLEAEARERAGSLRWSDGVRLVYTVLSSLVNLTTEATSPFVEDRELIRDVKPTDSEFSAERIRFALKSLVIHGLVDERQPPSRGLVPPRKRYGVASRHLSDFLVAQQTSAAVLATLRTGQRALYPRALAWRHNSAVLFAALLAEEGCIVTDDIWTEAAPQQSELDLLSALALVPPAVAASRRVWVQSTLKESTRGNREALRRVVLPVARVPGHPLGPSLLDEALRSLPLAERDQIWSVPENLVGTGPWRGPAAHVLDEVKLDPVIDEWNGRPLLIAWTCSSVVESRRRHAREQLAVWGTLRLDHMARLLDHMARIDDPQVVEDITVAALGAVMGAPFDDPALLLLARIVDRLYFADDAEAWTPDVIVRLAARGIIERAALFRPGEVDELLKRARPPYRARGPRWPDLDLNEIRENSHFGGEVVTGDLSWYVAQRCFSPFLVAARIERNDDQIATDPLSAVDLAVLKAAATGALQMPSDIARNCQAVLTQQERAFTRAVPDEKLIDALRVLYAQRESKSPAESAELDERELLRWAAATLVHDANPKAEHQPAWSEELEELRRHASALVGVSNVSVGAIRDALIAAHVRRWRWSKAGFCDFDRDDRDKPPRTVDVAIVRQYRQATHGSRSEVASFREKYVWAAVNCVAGNLADRLPVWDEETHRWTAVHLARVGTGMPDPLPRSALHRAAPKSEGQVWIPKGVWPELFSEEPVLGRRAEQWLMEAPLPDPRVFVRGSVEGWSDAALLAESLFRRGHQTCVDQAVQVACLGVPLDVAHLLRRDAPFLVDDWLYKAFAWVADSTYVSPALGCWASWLSHAGESDCYVSLDESGQPVPVHKHPLVTKVTVRDEDEHPGEPDAWFPAPFLRSTLGIVGAAGDRHLRHYLDRKRDVIAIERSLPHHEFAFSHHYLAIDLRRVLEACQDARLVPVWSVRLWREATPALWIEGHKRVQPSGLVHRSRDVSWLLFWNDQAQDLDVVPQTDVLDLWAGESR